MTFPASSKLYAANVVDALVNGTSNELTLDSASMKFALYNNSMVQDPESATNLGYSTTGEITNDSGTGYTAGGLAVTPTLTHTGGSVSFALSTDPVWSTITISSVYGAVVYDDAVTTDPVANAAIAAMLFSSVGSAGGGTFTVNLTTDLIFTWDIAP